MFGLSSFLRRFLFLFLRVAPAFLLADFASTRPADRALGATNTQAHSVL